MKKVIIHIGVHKTGSSSIQKRCHDDIKLLNENNITYPIFNVKGKKLSNHSFPLFYLFMEDIENYGMNNVLGINKEEVKLIKNDIEKQLIDHINNEIGTLLLSAEDACKFNPIAIKKMKNFFKDHGIKEHEIIIFTREHHSLITSSLQEVVKNGGELSQKLNITKATTSKYKNLIKNYSEHFKKIKVVSFEDVIKSNHGLIGNFYFNILKIKTNVEINDTRENFSISHEAVELLSNLNKKEILTNKEKKLIKNLNGTKLTISIDNSHIKEIDNDKDFLKQNYNIEYPKKIKTNKIIHWKNETLDELINISKKLTQRKRIVIGRFLIDKYKREKNSNYLLYAKKLMPNSIFIQKEINKLVNVGAVVVIKDEAPYIHEWIHHYLYKGFKELHICINRTSDNTLKILKKISTNHPNKVYIYDVDFFDLLDKNGFRRIQYSSYALVIGNINKKLSHLLMCDCDEFWFSEKHENINQYINEMGDFDCLTIPWAWQNGDVSSFLPPFKNIHYRVTDQVKSIINLRSYKKIREIQLHVPDFTDDATLINCNGLPLELCNDKNKKQRLKSKITNCHSMLLHRTMRSEIEYIAALIRGNPDENTPIKRNRNGFVIDNTGDADVKQLKKTDEEYYQSLNDFIIKNDIEDLLKNSREALEKEALNYRVKTRHLLDNKELFLRSFKNTRIEAHLKEELNHE